MGARSNPDQMEADPSNGWVVGSDAGQDRIYVWKLTPGATPPLTPAAIPFVNTPPGDGPRHFAFHPNGISMYSIQEEASTVMFWDFHRGTEFLRHNRSSRVYGRDSPVRTSRLKSAFPPTAIWSTGQTA